MTGLKAGQGVLRHPNDSMKLVFFSVGVASSHDYRGKMPLQQVYEQP